MRLCKDMKIMNPWNRFKIPIFCSRPAALGHVPHGGRGGLEAVGDLRRRRLRGLLKRRTQRHGREGRLHQPPPPLAGLRQTLPVHTDGVQVC